ncbi:RhuM family protein [Bacteroides thetaiotaomicron]|uniref:RhuM family protein n=1 Tax=Bacteroides thetaiotaomicron TaxID=818 RepID=UPI001899A6CB|nr:RhuM family protein [Bacteroides thetaiotaomicron]
MNDRGNIVIYQTKDGKTSIDVKLENETVWLTQAQMAELFQKDRTVIGRHINNVYREGELERDITCAKFAHMGSYSDQQYETAVYNLDVIISVGYRVKSQRGTQFRVWANKVLKEYLIKGYAVNQQVKIEQLEDLKNTVRLLSNVIEHKQLTLDEANGLLRVITDYTYGLDTLDKYDFQQLEVASTTPSREFRATYEEAMGAIHLLQEKFGSSDLFGNEKDQSFKSSINTIYQTFGGEDLYPSIEEKASMLFYLVVKNHSFSDGNKRIAAFLFLWFLEKNGILYKSDGSKLIGNNTLVALTLMIAESRTEEKDMMVKVVINLINKNN